MFVFALRYKVTYKKETGECRLEISMTFADDAGEYSIFAKNPHGEASASANLLEEGIHVIIISIRTSVGLSVVLVLAI